MKLPMLVCALSLLCVNAYAADNQIATPTGTNAESAQMTPDKNQSAGAAFLQQNKSKPGVVTLPDGLQYKVLKNGTGPKPTEQDTVVVHYRGTLIDGTEFDSSYKRGEPVSFVLSNVIPGWIEALKLMKAGSTWEIYIPAALAYGEQGAPPVIGPNQTLIFKVNLIEVKKA